MLDMDVQPLRGLGSLLFGMSREQVSSVLGPPTSIDRADADSENWIYDPLLLSVAFDESTGWRLVSFEVWHPETTVLGVRVFGRPQLSVLTELADFGLSRAEHRDGVESEESELYFADAALHLWGTGTQFTALSSGVGHDADDREDWPSASGDA